MSEKHKCKWCGSIDGQIVKKKHVWRHNACHAEVRELLKQSRTDKQADFCTTHGIK